MKKIYTIICLFFLAGFVSGQTYLLEDFSAGQMPPSGWTIQNLPNQWSCAASSIAGGAAPEGKFTYTNGVSVTRLISPVVNLTGMTTVTLMFNHMYDWYSNPAPKLGVATRTGTGDWTSVWEITPTSNIGPQTKVLTISNSDIGSGFQFCFYLDGNFYNLDYWYVDDITLLTPPELDAALTKIKLPQYLSANDSASLTGKVKNMGTTVIHSFDIGYSIDGGQQIISSYAGLNLGLGVSYDFTHSEPLVFSNPGSYKVDVKVQNVNGGIDDDPANDTLSTHIGVVPWLPDKKVFCEEATGTWCGWCVRGICFMDYMTETYPDTWIGVAVHNGDPMVVTEWDDEIPNIIPDFPGYPSGTIDRVKMWDPQDFEQGYLEQMEAISPATVEIVNFAWDPDTRIVSFDVQSQFVIDIFNELRFCAVISEDSLYGTGSDWAQSNYYAGGGQGEMCGFETKPNPIPAASMHYDHVGRAILDSPYGTVGSITEPITAGSTQSYHYEYTIPETWKFDKLHFIGLIMDHTGGVILNATEDVIWVGTSELNNDLRLRIFPNPASDKATLQYTLDKPGIPNIRIYDLPGNCFRTLDPVQSQIGMNKIQLDLSGLRQGFYFVEVTVNGHSNTHKVAVTR
ncbi:MAG: T9SS type A sorting domain-containing protein [Bacteroidales bacterium]|nr:T9SS type A sorting domain-containing protein [Bacteroidales bacterium]